MELYLDTADVTAVKRLARILPLHGVTTNPSIVAKEGKPILGSAACAARRPRWHRQAVRAGDGGRCRAHGGGGGAAQPARTGAGGEDPGNRRGTGCDQEA